MKHDEFTEYPPGLPPPRLAMESGAGIQVPTSVGPGAVRPDHIGAPGEYPFTRGIFPDGYKGRMWTIRQYSGFGTAEESNERYKFLLAQGQTGLSVALDLPTQCGYDPIHPMARSEIDEGVDALGLSILSGSHKELVSEVFARLHELDAADIKVFVGGTIPHEDQQELRELGVAGVYTADMPLSDVVAALARALA